MVFFAFMTISCGTTREVEISGFSRLFISDFATDNITPTAGASGAATFPIQGIPTQGTFQQGGILSASKIIIKGSTDATISIERGFSGNHGPDTADYIERAVLPTSHLFGNLHIEENSIKREHVVN